MAKGRVEKRGRKLRQEKPIVLIVSEGSHTEPKYFGYYRSRQKNIKIEIDHGGAKKNGTDYNSLVKIAMEYAKKNGISTHKGDSIWIVADGDINYNNPDPVNEKKLQLNMARKVATKNSITILLSNPCFELWYLLHFKYTTAFIKDSDTIIPMLRNYIPQYSKSGDIAPVLADKLELAIANAKRLAEYHRTNGGYNDSDLAMNPFTEVYRLMEAIK